ncbi:MAG TPA: peptidyl-prolyl cis-trans isomerase [Methylomirabilota bacterium]|nr:peptidyl-prolyl cis-trans isomerase [Methylomirabilota bacterium]
MISIMRDYARSLKVLLLAVIVIFILTSGVLFFFGTGGFTPGGKTNIIASVNGEEISLDRFRRAQANYAAAYERLTRQRMTPELAERLGLSQQVLNELITEAVVVQGAAREGIRVGDDELRSRIQEIREFQEDGRFSRDQYLKMLRQIRIEPGSFETEVRRQLVRRKVEGLIKEGVKVSDGELRQAYDLRHEKVRAAWAFLDVRPLIAQVSASDGDLDAYLKSHTAQFTRPERRRLQYVLVSPKAFAQPVSDADAEAYYKEHGAQFEQPRRVRVAHVLVRVPPVGGSEAENQSKAKVEEVIRRAKAGEDFAKLAREVSDDKANAAQGGELGFVGPGELVPAFEQAAFALKKGEITASPVRTPFGYHAIKVLDVKEGGRTPLKDVAAKIKEALLNERSDRAARARADEIKPKLQAAADFAAEARALGLEVREATIGRGDPLEGVGRDAQLEEAVFSMSMGGVSAPARTAGGYAMVKVLGQNPAGVPPLAEIKDRVVEAYRRERAAAMATDKARALTTALGKGGDFRAAARLEGFTTGDLPLFSRAEPPKERANVPNAVFLAAAQTSAGVVSEPLQTDSGIYVVKTLDRQPGDAAGFEKERAELERQVLEQKRNLAWEGWVRTRLASAKIEVGGERLPPR